MIAAGIGVSPIIGGANIGPNGGWRPTDANPSLNRRGWWDISDPNSVTVASGRITDVEDQFGTYDLTTSPTESKKPLLYAAEQNGLNVMYCYRYSSPSSSYLYLPVASVPDDSICFDVFVVSKWDAAGAAEGSGVGGSALDSQDGSKLRSLGLYDDSGTWRSRTRIGGAVWSNHTDSRWFPSDEWTVLHWKKDSDSKHTIRFINSSYDVASTPVTDGGSSDGLVWGADYQGQGGPDMWHAEMFRFTHATLNMSADEISSSIAYLQWKWGISGP